MRRIFAALVLAGCGDTLVTNVYVVGEAGARQESGAVDGGVVDAPQTLDASDGDADAELDASGADASWGLDAADAGPATCARDTTGDALCAAQNQNDPWKRRWDWSCPLGKYALDAGSMDGGPCDNQTCVCKPALLQNDPNRQALCCAEEF